MDAAMRRERNVRIGVAFLTVKNMENKRAAPALAAGAATKGLSQNKCNESDNEPTRQAAMGLAAA
jgi:hypothetical protein